jgi:hypothetical protein
MPFFCKTVKNFVFLEEKTVAFGKLSPAFFENTLWKFLENSPLWVRQGKKFPVPD